MASGKMSKYSAGNAAPRDDDEDDEEDEEEEEDEECEEGEECEEDEEEDSPFMRDTDRSLAARLSNEMTETSKRTFVILFCLFPICATVYGVTVLEELHNEKANFTASASASPAMKTMADCDGSYQFARLRLEAAERALDFSPSPLPTEADAAPLLRCLEAAGGAPGTPQRTRAESVHRAVREWISEVVAVDGAELASMKQYAASVADGVEAWAGGGNAHALALRKVRTDVGELRRRVDDFRPWELEKQNVLLEVALSVQELQLYNSLFEGAFLMFLRTGADASYHQLFAHLDTFAAVLAATQAQRAALDAGDVNVAFPADAREAFFKTLTTVGADIEGWRTLSLPGALASRWDAGNQTLKDIHGFLQRLSARTAAGRSSVTLGAAAAQAVKELDVASAGGMYVMADEPHETVRERYDYVMAVAPIVAILLCVAYNLVAWKDLQQPPRRRLVVSLIITLVYAGLAVQLTVARHEGLDGLDRIREGFAAVQHRAYYVNELMGIATDVHEASMLYPLSIMTGDEVNDNITQRLDHVVASIESLTVEVGKTGAAVGVAEAASRAETMSLLHEKASAWVRAAKKQLADGARFAYRNETTAWYEDQVAAMQLPSQLAEPVYAAYTAHVDHTKYLPLFSREVVCREVDTEDGAQQLWNTQCGEVEQSYATCSAIGNATVCRWNRICKWVDAQGDEGGCVLALVELSRQLLSYSGAAADLYAAAGGYLLAGGADDEKRFAAAAAEFGASTAGASTIASELARELGQDWGAQTAPAAAMLTEIFTDNVNAIDTSYAPALRGWMEVRRRGIDGHVGNETMKLFITTGQGFQGVLTEIDIAIAHAVARQKDDIASVDSVVFTKYTVVMWIAVFYVWCFVLLCLACVALFRFFLMTGM